MSLPRFYIPPEAWNERHPVLDEGESRHAASVLRLREGEMVSVFNGLGSEVHALITQLGKRQTLLDTVRVFYSKPLPARIILAQAIPKGKNLDLVLQKATELGVSEIIPLITTRTVARPEASEAADKQEKWQRVVIEACKQCGQNFLPKVHAPIPYNQFLADLPHVDLPLIAALDETAQPLHTLLSSKLDRPASALILIGPEGDFTKEETAAARAAGCAFLTLGPIILRTETAAVYSLSVLGHELFRA